MHNHVGGFRASWRPTVWVLALVAVGVPAQQSAWAGQLLAGIGRVDITNLEAGPVHDPLYVKALVLKNDTTTAAIITVDAVAIAEIGTIRNDYLATVRAQIDQKLKIPPSHVLINASHCHGRVGADVGQRTVQAVRLACQSLVPVTIGAGVGHEDRIMENRRLKLRSGAQADVRHAYSLPPDEEVSEVGPVDPAIGVLRLDRTDGRTLAVVYHFACHPIQGVPSGANTADLVGFASGVIEDNLSDGTLALFLQGCAGDVNPVRYKDVDHPRSAEPLGHMLGLSTLQAVRTIQCRPDDRLTVINETIELPRADWTPRIAALEAEQKRLVESLQGTSLNLKTFLPLAVKYQLSSDYPSYYAHLYLHERALGRDDLAKLDAANRDNMKQYIHNIHIMEQLTRNQTNLGLLRMHQTTNAAAAKPTLEAEVVGLRVGDLVLVTFPGELSVQIGLNIKQASPHERTVVAGYTNGYLYYAPTAEQLGNPGAAQEDCDCLLAPAWQKIFEDKAAEILGRL
ncbi:MAG: hypothetical protein MUF48_05465 [Pirellulaceae bacterium]|jgi:hypothetical protein|nr:hypothetical protein [Pirellulaceae bacterium]